MAKPVKDPRTGRYSYDFQFKKERYFGPLKDSYEQFGTKDYRKAKQILAYISSRIHQGLPAYAHQTSAVEAESEVVLYPLWQCRDADLMRARDVLKRAPGTVKSYSDQWEILTRVLGENFDMQNAWSGQKIFVKVRRQEESQMGRRISGQTIGRQLSTLMRGFREAAKDNRWPCPQNLFDLLKVPVDPSAPEHDRHARSNDELVRFFQYLVAHTQNPEAKIEAFFALATGLRWQTIKLIKRKHIVPDSDRSSESGFRFVADLDMMKRKKRKYPYSAPLSVEAIRAINAALEYRVPGEDHVFSNTDFTKAYDVASMHCGIQPRIKLSDLRATFASRTFAEHKDYGKVMFLLDHGSPNVTMTYLENLPDAKADAQTPLGDLLKMCLIF